MAGKQLRENQEPISGSEAWKSDEISPLKFTMSSFDSCDLKQVETYQESEGSSEELESPTSVADARNWTQNLAYVHYQIRRIREEDLHLGEDIGEGFNAKEKTTVGGWSDLSHQFYNHRVNSRMDLVFFSRPILPSSPLSGKATLKAFN